MSVYKLTYFNLNALVEPIRWTFKVAQVDFEDERFEKEEWSQIKGSGRLPGKQVPLLEIDGKIYTQTNTILRYLGKKFGLVADDDLSNFRIDQVVDIISDGRSVFHRYFLHSYLHPDAEKKEEVKQELKTNVLPVVLKQVNDIVSATEGSYITGTKLTWGDLVVANWLQIWQSQIDANLLEKYPALVKLEQEVLSLPQIKAWLEIRPKVPF